MNKTVTLGMFAVGVLILWARLWWFWRKGGRYSRNWSALAPFGLAAVAFAGAGAAAGGLLGRGLWWVREQIGAGGDWLLFQGVGAKGTSSTTSGSFGVLSPFGSVIMLALLIAFVITWKTARRRPKLELAWGAPCGLMAGPFLGAVTLVPLINLLGTWFIGPFFHQH